MENSKTKMKIASLIFESSDDDDCLTLMYDHESDMGELGNDAAPLIMLESQMQAPLFNHRLEGFVSRDIPKYNDPTFKAHFRMKRSSFQLLIDEFALKLKTRTVEPSTKLLCFIWLVATEESYRSVADRFGMSKGSLHMIAIEVANVLAANSSKFIVWPSSSEKRCLADEGQQRSGFPGAFGFVDGWHVAIKGRTDNRESYINRMGFSSILLQGVANVHLKFIHAYVGWPGSVHDARMFRNSDLFHLLDSVPGDLHILGYSAYPLLNSLMTPFKDNGNLNSSQKKFNVVHGAARSAIERSFALLKGKFRRLKYLDMSIEKEIPNVVMSCMVLHNFILSNEKIDDQVMIQENDDTFMPFPAAINTPESSAAMKRNSLAASM